MKTYRLQLPLPGGDYTCNIVAESMDDAVKKLLKKDFLKDVPAVNLRSNLKEE